MIQTQRNEEGDEPWRDWIKAKLLFQLVYYSMLNVWGLMLIARNVGRMLYHLLAAIKNPN